MSVKLECTVNVEASHSGSAPFLSVLAAAASRGRCFIALYKVTGKVKPRAAGVVRACGVIGQLGRFVRPPTASGAIRVCGRLASTRKPAGDRCDAA